MGRGGGMVQTAFALAQRWHCGSLGSQIHRSFCPRQRSQAAFCEFALAMLMLLLLLLSLLLLLLLWCAVSAIKIGAARSSGVVGRLR